MSAIPLGDPSKVARKEMWGLSRDGMITKMFWALRVLLSVHTCINSLSPHTNTIEGAVISFCEETEAQRG